MSIAEEGRLVAKCGLCRKRRSLTTFRTSITNERVCGECWLDAFTASIERRVYAAHVTAVMDGEPIPNPHYAFRRAIAAPGYGAT